MLTALLENFDYSAVSIDFYFLAGLDNLCAAPDIYNSGDAVFAGDDGAMTERSAYIGDDGRGAGEEGRPGGGGQRSDEDVARFHAREVFGAMDDAGGPADAAGAGGDAFQRVGGFPSATRLQGD